MKINMLNEYVLIKPFVKANVSKGGIILPSELKESVERGVVVDVCLDGDRISYVQLRKNDEVLFYPSDVVKIQLDNIEHYVIKMEKLIATVTDDTIHDDY